MFPKSSAILSPFPTYILLALSNFNFVSDFFKVGKTACSALWVFCLVLGRERPVTSSAAVEPLAPSFVRARTISADNGLTTKFSLPVLSVSC